MRRFKTFLVFLGALGFFSVSINQCRSSLYPFSKLIPHLGVLGAKSKKVTKERKKNYTVLFLKLLNNNSEFSVRFFNPYFDNSLEIGDSILLYTRKQGGNFNRIMIANQDGSEISSAAGANEVLHLIKLNNQEILLDYSKQQKLLKNEWWVFLLCAFPFLGWFFWRLSGRSNSVLVRERGG